MFLKPNAAASEAKHRLHRFGDKSPTVPLCTGQMSQETGLRIGRILGASECTHEAQVDRLLRE